MTLTTIIMAGGLGKRMNSETPKVLHLVKGKPMLCYVLEKAFEVGSDHNCLHLDMIENKKR